MTAPDLSSSLGIALGCLLAAGGASCVLASIVLVAPSAPRQTEAGPLDWISLLGDFTLVLMDSLPFFSLFRAARELPAAARQMKAKWVAEPLIPRFFFIGLPLLIGGVLITSLSLS